MRTFVRLRQMLVSNETLIERLDELEKRKPIGFRPKAAKKIEGGVSV
jgi:hypothetical protein